MSSGNSESQNFDADAVVDHHFGRWQTVGKFSFPITRQDDETTAQRLVASLEPRFDFTDRSFAFNFLEYEDDQFSGFDYQITETLGLGYRLVDTDEVSLSVQIGAGVLHSNLDGGGSETDPSARVSNDFEWQISGGAKLTNTNAALFTNQRIDLESTTAVTTKLVGSLSLRASFEIRHDTAPPADVEATDTLTKVSLVYSF